MFFVTGDVHGDYESLRKRGFPHLRKTDSIVVCGDLGLIWTGSKPEQKLLRAAGGKRFNTLFVDGTHENFSLLNAYPVTEWCGGKAQVISGSLIHLMRGQVYTIEGKHIFAFGGGESDERDYRIAENTWWEQQMPSQEEMDEGMKNLEACGWQVDYIFTHEGPTRVKRLFAGQELEPNALNVYFDGIAARCAFRKWVFGCYHRPKTISYQFESVFENVTRLN